MKYLIIKTYEIDIPDTEVALELKKYYESEMAPQVFGLSIEQVCENMVEDFHVGDHTDMVSEVSTTFRVITPHGPV